MFEVDALLKESQYPLAAGNIVTPLRACIEALHAASHIEKRGLYDRIREVVTRDGPAMSPGEIDTLHKLLDAHQETGVLKDEKAAVLERLASLERASPSETPGRVNILFASEVPFLGKTFGVVQPLELSTRAWGGRITLRQQENAAEDLYDSFHVACEAALDFFLSQGLPMIDGSILMNGYSIEGNFPQLRFPAKGGSLGLGAAIAVISRLLNIPVRPAVAFTGRIDLHGNVHAVGQMEEKLQAASEKGLQEVFVPQVGSDHIGSNLSSKLKLRPVSLLQEVVEALFEPSKISQGIASLREIPIPEESRKRHWRVLQQLPSDCPRVLLTAVGKSDPIGTIKDQHGQGLKKEDGPILALCREIRPNYVYLFFTTGPGENNYSEKARAVREFLEREDLGCKVVDVPLDNLKDPTDISKIYASFRSVIEQKVTAGHDPERTAFYINSTSGTGQMQTAWHLLVERRVIPAQLLQVRESRWAEGESRVRAVVWGSE